MEHLKIIEMTKQEKNDVIDVLKGKFAQYSNFYITDTERNAFTVFPGHPAALTFTPQTPGDTPRFIVRDLHSATYGTH